MTRKPTPAAQEAEQEQEKKQTLVTSGKPVAGGEKPLQPRPGTRGPDGKVVPPPPHPRGKPFPKKNLKPGDAATKEALFRQEIRLRTRSECERVCEKIANWMKDKLIDANLGNAMTNTVRAVLQSKTATEEMELKVADRELLRRIQELEERAGMVEETVGMNSGERKLQ